GYAQKHGSCLEGALGQPSFGKATGQVPDAARDNTVDPSLQPGTTTPKIRAPIQISNDARTGLAERFGASL
ncbi:MAG: hypothetical protein NXH74_12530, partial [Rhodobacteraceae bacterium]|nr:hypothetical protein [Paracoccaceae bacterium]